MDGVDAVLTTFETQAYAFWMFMAHMSGPDKQRASSSHAYHQVLQTTFNISQCMREELMRVDGGGRRYDYDVVCNKVV